MRVLRIKSHSMPEALAEAKRQLGEGVTVLHTKQNESPVWFGLGRRIEVEIIAAESASPVSATPIVAAKSLASGADGRMTDIRRALVGFETKREIIAEPRRSLVIEKLIRNGVPETLADALALEIDAVKESSEIHNILARRIRCSGPVNIKKRQSRVALVGPTGVGKTTTAAKLAAQFSLVFAKKTALITLDTYRVGAVEQLSAFAKILGIPIEVALCPEDVDALVARHRDKDLIIIDTVGRSQRNGEHISELERFVKAARPTEVHLVVSASSSPAVQKEAVTGFSRLSADRVILTKLDECPLTGTILDLAAGSLLPYSYITFGQEVPDDIAPAESCKLARLVWEGSY